jgi:ubiquinone/menaquinone biosynthesis C-methylase UbiE
MSWDAARAASFYDDYGEKEWARFENGVTSRASLVVHVEYLRRFVHPGALVLDAGAGPGRFTIELARLGADVVVLDLSPRQLDLNRERVTDAGFEERIRDRVLGDVTDLSRFDDESFDHVVCYGGALSYVVDRADKAVAELVRVTRPGGYVLVSAMTLVGAFVHFRDIALDLAVRDGADKLGEVVRTGFLPDEPDYGHLAMTLYRWRELEQLLGRHAMVVAASAAGLLGAAPEPEDPERAELLARFELELACEPGALDCGPHVLAVLRKDQ